MPMPSLPGSTPASQPFQPSSSLAAVSRHLAWVRCLPHPKHPGDAQWPVWLTACYQLTPYLQRFGANSALLDLGPCTDAEAVAVVQALITRQAHQQITLRAAIAPSSILAQLALLRLLHKHISPQAPAYEPLTVLTSEQTADLLRHIPIAALAHLQFADPTIVTSSALTQTVSRLEDYGVRTLAHLARLARLNDDFLRRQFGTCIALLLAAVARCEDPLPLQPTPAPHRLHFRLRPTTPVAADCLLAGLAPFTLEVASALARRGLQAHTVELRLRWETGDREQVVRTVAQPVIGGRALAETVRLMLITIFQDAIRLQTLGGIEDFHLILSHLVPCYPARHAFWPQRARRLAATQELADLLARRHGKPLLFRSTLTAPDAIFDRDRSRLTPLTADVAAVADVAEGSGHPARPVADVTDTSDDSAEIPHGLHWW